MKYGYVRVSSIGQNIDRQMDEMLKLDLEKKSLSTNKAARILKELHIKKLKRKLKKGDLLFVKSIDRLGRDTMIIEEWHHY